MSDQTSPVFEVPLFDDEYGLADDPVFTRAKGFVLVRESTKYAMTVFDSMRVQTLLPLSATEPPVKAILNVGMTPFHCGEYFTVEEIGANGEPTGTKHLVQVEVRQRGSTKLYLFEYGGFVHGWSQASAAKETAGINDFTELLIEALYQYRPEKLYAANFSRIIRSARQGARLQGCILSCVDTIVTESQEFPMANDNPIGMTLWNVFTMITSQDRAGIVQRTFCGRIYGFNRGEWPLGENTVPFGYVWAKETKSIVPDPSMRSAVRQMLIILASDLPPNEKQAQMGAIGVTSMRKRKKDGTPALVTELADPTALMNSLLAWAPIWIQGEFLLRHANSIVGLEMLSGVPVVRRPVQVGTPTGRDELGRQIFTEPDLGEFQMLCKVPVPEGGWAEPEVLEALEMAAIANSSRLIEIGRTKGRPLSARMRDESVNARLHAQVLSPMFARGNDQASEERRASARAHKTLAPFTGRTWSDPEYNYELQILAKRRYRILRWPLDTLRSALSRPRGLRDLDDDVDIDAEGTSDDAYSDGDL